MIRFYLKVRVISSFKYLTNTVAEMEHLKLLCVLSVLLANSATAQIIDIRDISSSLLFENKGEIAGITSMAHIVIPINLAEVGRLTNRSCNVALDFKTRLDRNYARVVDQPKAAEQRLRTISVVKSAIYYCQTLLKEIKTMENVWLTPAPFWNTEKWYSPPDPPSSVDLEYHFSQSNFSKAQTVSKKLPVWLSVWPFEKLL